MAENNFDGVVDAIVNLIYRVLNRPDAPLAHVYIYIWQNVNANDSNLSDLTDLRGNSIVGVPKATSDTFSQMDTVLCTRGPGVPITIIGKMRGDIRNTLI